MSTNSLNAVEQQIIVQLPALYAGRYSTLSSAVLLLYDYILTFPLEQRHIWRGKMNATKILFVLNRYCAIIYLYGLVINYFLKPATNTNCQVFYYINEIANTIFPFAITSIFILRTYAIYGKSKTVLCLLAIPGSVLVTSGIWVTVVQTAVAVPLELQIGPLTCSFNASSSYYAAIFVNYISETVFDALVVILTLYRTGRLAMQSREASINKSLSFILLRDGMLYYSTYFAPQFVTVVLNAIILRTGSANLSDIFDAMSTVINVIQIIMANRLVLSLSNAADAREDSEFRSRTGLEPPTFATGPFLGNIGGPVRTLPDDFDDEFLEDDERVDGDNIESNIAKLDTSDIYEMRKCDCNISSGVYSEIEEISV